MTRHDDGIAMQQMLDHAQEAVSMSRGRNREDLQEDRMLQLALVRLVEIVGEAATRVSREAQERHPNIPWRQARAMRNRLIHAYDKIDLSILWDTIYDDLPTLIVHLKEALNG